MFDLSFTLSIPSKQILEANIAQMENQMAASYQEVTGAPNEIQAPGEMFQMPIVKRQGKVHKKA